MGRRLIALSTVAIAIGGALGCSNHPSVSTADEPFSSSSNGLWALDGAAENGDIELLQLDGRSYASVVRQEQARPQAMTDAPADAPRAPASIPAPANDNEPEPTGRAETGNLTRAPAARASAQAPVSLVAEDQQFTVTETADTLTLTDANGRVLTYTRSYRLYCVPTDRGTEATTILELGKEPKVVGVNGDGIRFPHAGTYDASVRSDVLFRLQEYVITAKLGDSSVIVELPWAEMHKGVIHGSVSIVGPANAAAPTPISCERVRPPQH